MMAVVLLSVAYFSHQSLRLDEAQSLWQTSRSPAAILTVVGQDVHVPLYHELLHFWRLYIGDSVAWARGFSLLWLVLSIPALYLLGKRAYGQTAGLIAASLLAVSPFMNWYGSEIRMYTLFMFLVIVNQYAFLHVWKGSTRDEAGAEHAWVVYILTAILGIYTHYFFFLVLGTQALFYFLRRELFPKGSLRRFIFAAALVVLAFAPWGWWVLHQGQILNSTPDLARPTTVDLFNAVAQFFFGFQDDHLNTVILSLWPLALLAGFLALRKRDGHTLQTEYLVLSVIVPIAAVFCISFVTPLFVSRYLIFTVPALYVMFANLLVTLPARGGVWARTALVGAMALALVIEMYNPSAPVKENYRAAADYLAANAQAQDAIVLAAPFTIYPVEYYYRGSANISTLPVWDRYTYGPIPPFVASQLGQEVSSTTEGHQNVWLLLSYDQGYNKQIKDYFDQHYTALASTTFSPGLDLYKYQVGYGTPLAKLTKQKQP